MKKPTNFSLLLLCLVYVVDRQPKTKERNILSSSLFLPFTDERTTRRRSHEGKRETDFRMKPSFIILLLKFVRAQKSVRGFYFAPCCPLLLSKIAAFPFVVVECDDEKKRSIYARVVKK